MVHASVLEGHERDFEAAFAEVTGEVAGTPGHRRDELLRGAQPGSYILLSEWDSKEDFLMWEDDPIHKKTTTPMRPHWGGPVRREIWDVAVSRYEAMGGVR